MKNTIRCLMVMAFALSFSFAEAQVIGKESLVMKKNIFIGVKGGITAMDMQYKNGNSFVNHSALYQDFFGSLKGSWIGSVFVERTLPGWSYGLEFNFHALYAKSKPEEPHYALQDSAYFANVRIPVKLKFLEDYLFSPYIFMAPEIGTYVSDTTVISLCSTSIINGEQMLWGTNNARDLNLNLIAGAGVEGKIQIGLYEIRARFEAGYRLGLLSTTPKDYPFDRRMRGWEATIGLAFPLFINPSYTWLN